MAGDRRHVEFFGPDLARGPFSSGQAETAAVQIATLLAQVRAPLLRSDDEIRDHAAFIREIADRLMPDHPGFLRADPGEWNGADFTIQTSVRAPNGETSLLNCWLADEFGGKPTTHTVDSVTWNTGTVIQTIAAKKHYVMLTPRTGVLDVTVAYSSPRTFYWAISRGGHVYYSPPLVFQ